MDIKSKAKEEVLQRIIDAMDERMVGGLKSKSPKFMKVETNDPELAENVVQSALKAKMEDGEHIRPEMDEDHSPDMEPDVPASSESDDEDLERLKEMYARLK